MPRSRWLLVLVGTAIALPSLRAQREAPNLSDAQQPVSLAVKISTRVSDSIVVPSKPFSLIVDVEPAKGVHLYAPGASDYRSVALTIAPDPIVKLRPMRYPASELYYFAPLKESVPVYQKPFSLTQDATIELSQKTREVLRRKEPVTIKATLEYQACTDKVCFAPVSAPLAWSIRLQQR